MRTKLSFELVCAECGEILECDPDMKDDNRVRFNSAFTAEGKMAIKPCQRCIDDAKEPMRLIHKALELSRMGGGR